MKHIDRCMPALQGNSVMNAGTGRRRTHLRTANKIPHDECGMLLFVIVAVEGEGLRILFVVLFAHPDDHRDGGEHQQHDEEEVHVVLGGFGSFFDGACVGDQR